ncbi:MAG: SufD family Fe-S cluster assembly protein [bacterium]|nr:SufD family Fe-S cluster assembly protein [bacterium]
MRQVSIIVEKNEERVEPFVWINGKRDEFTLNVRLVGEGASFKLIGLFLGSGDHHLVFNTTIVHEAPRTKSLTTIRGVFRDTSSFSNDGVVRIQKGAKVADGFFSSKVLLFDNAKGRSVPSLEIDENELKAGHASTVGRPDPTLLFYLQSRGLSEKQAVELIVSGFFTPLLTFLPVKKTLAVKRKLGLTRYE